MFGFMGRNMIYITAGVVIATVKQSRSGTNLTELGNLGLYD